MLEVKQFKSEIFGSNTYSITSLTSNEEVYLIDCGAYEEVLEIFEAPFFVKGIFITHYHYDHIYRIEEWLRKFPDLMVYGSEITKMGIASEKRNLSFYHDDPISLDIKKFKVLSDGDEVLLWENLKIKSITTEGHCEGSSSFVYGNFIFTGDALIPNIPIVTKLKTGDKLEARLSVEKIKFLCEQESVICPGHLDITTFSNVKWEDYRSV